MTIDGETDALSGLRSFIENKNGQVRENRLPPERALASQLGVSRRALRNALEVLEAEGRIWRRQGQGTFIGPPPLARTRRLGEISEHTSPAEIMEVRLELEPILARFAAMRASRAEIQEIRRLATLIGKAEDSEEYERADSALHREIAAAAGNGLFLAMFDIISAMRREAGWWQLRAETFSRTRAEQLTNQHMEILSAIEKREARAAEQAMRHHLRFIMHDLLGIE